jgi:hypothetical protein
LGPPQGRARVEGSMLPAAGARRSAYVPVAGAAARRAVWQRRRRLGPVELDHHLTSPTSRESHARTHARTHTRTHARASTQVTDWRTHRRAPAAPARSATRSRHSRAPDARERQVTGARR